MSNMQNIKQICKRYNQTSGQIINFSKFIIYNGFKLTMRYDHMVAKVNHFIHNNKWRIPNSIA